MKWLLLSFLCVIAVSAHALKCEYTFYAQPSFQEAKAFIRSQGIQTRTAFQAWKRAGKKPKNFPGAPQKTYKDEWTNWGDFLGTRKRNRSSNKKKEWMSFQDAKTFIQNQGIQTSREFNAWSKSGNRPTNFPSNPKQTYKDEWTNWDDFLGTENISNNKTENTSSNKTEWMNFQDAQTFIQNQGIQTSTEFLAWSKSGKRPQNFPSNPQKIYKDEWTNWNDFLGTEWMSFQDAQNFIQSEDIQNSTEFLAWSKSGKRPQNFPSNPETTYKDEWTDWDDFLGTGNISTKKRKWMSFQEAKDFIQRQSLQTSSIDVNNPFSDIFIQNQSITSQSKFNAWKRAGKRPKNFPSRPEKFYKDEWTSWGDFLGTDNIAPKKRDWMSFQDAKAFIQSQGITSQSEFWAWKEAGKRPKNFPGRPDQFYKDEWTSWQDFLGTDNIAPKKREWMSFHDAKNFIQQQGITNESEFQAWKRAGKRPKNFPSVPSKIYNDEWISWGDFLGTGNISNHKKDWMWMSFQDAQNFIQQQGVTSQSEFQAWKKAGKRPKNFPSVPQKTYKDEWISWGDFLGTENTSLKNKEWMSFQDAKDFIQSEGIQNSTEFKAWKKASKRPKNFPSAPWQVYEDEWTNWKDFLGTGWMNFQEAKTFIQQQEVTNQSEFRAWSKSEQRPKNFPSSPEQTYKDEWISWNDFLGTENTDYMKDRTDKKHTEVQEYMSYTEAKIFVQQLEIKTPIDFFEIQRNEPDVFPENFPPKPRVFYTNTGEWTDWNDFLGLLNTSQKKINSSKQTQGFIDWLDNTDENIENDQNVEGDFTDGFPNEEPDIEKYF